jgi:hypothetical protein
MAVVMKVVIPDGTAELYDAIMEALEWETTEKPAGFISHVAGPGPNGWTVIDVWESEADFQRFVESRLGAAMAQATGGDPPQIEPTFFPIHNMDQVPARV